MFCQDNAFFNDKNVKRTVFLLLFILIFGEILLYTHRGISSGMYVRVYEPRSEKTGLRGNRPGLTQTGLCNH